MLDLIMHKAEQARLWYDTVWEHRDKRVDGWFLMGSPLPTMCICLAYVYIVKVIIGFVF